MRIQFKYKNHKGAIEDRDVDVIEVGFSHMNHPDYGYQPGWAFTGFDYSRGRKGDVTRTFHLCNVIIEDGPGTFILFRLPKAGVVEI